jgi:hypothetical protein
VNKEAKGTKLPRSENISFLISICQEGLIQAFAKAKGTKRFHMIAFFDHMNKYLINRGQFSDQNVVHVMDVRLY